MNADAMIVKKACDCQEFVFGSSRNDWVPATLAVVTLMMPAPRCSSCGTLYKRVSQ